MQCNLIFHFIFSPLPANIPDMALFSWIDPHDVLDEGFSDSSGVFRLAGATQEFTAMEPALEIYHDCNDGIKNGFRKLRIGLPDQYITAGLVPQKTVNVGVINLELIYKEETRHYVDDEDTDERTSVSPSFLT
ncbi:Mediator of RNA polymerase II transcription subun it 22 [Trichostrongylus colubriformis]|uniref:Mediator of RNA polymerase II transcription subun it 22 n=1 Tax=Trichostrongylus colubriformis TaxID=6319 RepID=A0AAN8I9L4_TRICO